MAEGVLPHVTVSVASLAFLKSNLKFLFFVNTFGFSNF